MATSIRTAAGAALETGQARAWLLVCFVGVARRGSQRLQTFVPKPMREMASVPVRLRGANIVSLCQEMLARCVLPVIAWCAQSPDFVSWVRTQSHIKIFLSEWDSPKKAPSVEKAYEIILPREARTRHDRFKAANPKFEEVRSFHSAQCICDLVRSCFKSFAFGINYNSGRFGEGIYSYRNPGLADNFATSCTTSPYRVMIACDVLVEPDQTAGDDATDEESLFVQSADAILPVHVVMYCQV
ncbi:hypothetical protein D9619_004278 [Psilocybe cf. subviscida]|uniref:PARP catalytic domain-containing protein n=1 Tax=Psilocybe cf. subviscida TaxID=2480587 RepID=A0A8H5BPM5_9AGAR|nr:hypothetical protein D9619_004278 [Psilocybe cf. subviscida]